MYDWLDVEGTSQSMPVQNQTYGTSSHMNTATHSQLTNKMKKIHGAKKYIPCSNSNPLAIPCYEHAPVRTACAVHDELILLVKKEHVEKWKDLLKNAMESAEAKWLGDVPAIADVNVGETWQETH